LAVKKGAVFDCYIWNGQEFWYDRDYGIENMSKEWAEKYLTNIRVIE